MVKLVDIIDILENVAPLCKQEDYDNSGLLVGNKNDQIFGAVISLDCTEEVIEEAKSLHFNLVICHHPVIFKGLKRLTDGSFQERAIIKAIKNDISIYAIHTNLDNAFINGVNHKIASKIGLSNLSILKNRMHQTTVDEDFGSGILGEICHPMKLPEILAHIKHCLPTPVIRFAGNINRDIQKIAVCGGAGSFLLKAAISKKADLFLSSDFKYHEFFDADKDIIIADIGHYESEQFTSELIFDILSQNFDNFALRCTKVNTNPINYFF
jgi:dinuclear metal center YbgI/SA1388 family protein